MTILPKGRTWKAHNGRRARLRYLRQVCRPILHSRDPLFVAAIEKVRVATSGESEPEYGMLFLLNRAREIADDTDAPWPEIMDLVMGMLIQAVEEPVA